MNLSIITALGYIEFATGFGILAFWVLFFTVGLAPAVPPTHYFSFEYSFILPDGVLALGLIIAGTCLVKGQNLGRGILLACAGGLIFLGLVDSSFNLQHSIYSGPILDAALSAMINIWCVALGLGIVIALKTGLTIDQKTKQFA